MKQDPIIKTAMALIEATGKSIAKNAETIGVSSGTLYHWRSGKTSSPYHRTVKKVFDSFGIRYEPELGKRRFRVIEGRKSA